MNWKVYNELAWVEPLLTDSENYSDEALIYINALKKYVNLTAPTMLHMGCGAGGHDYHFKKYFTLTGVDLSNGMLAVARSRNPEVRYIQADMKNITLNEQFDVVIIPDAIAYMTTLTSLDQTIRNAVVHLKPNGVLLIVAQLQDDYQDNNFVYSGIKDILEVTVFENNHRVADSLYEAAMIYLIRKDGKLTIEHEIHTLGLFSYQEWLSLFSANGLMTEEIDFDHLYDSYLLDQGVYKLKAFIGKFKTLQASK